MTNWIMDHYYVHKISGVKVRMIGWSTDKRPVVEKADAGIDDWTCYDLSRQVMDMYRDETRDRLSRCDHRRDSQGHCVFDCDSDSREYG